VQAAGQLVEHLRQRPTVGHLALDAFGNDLVVAGHIGLEVAVLGVAHGASAGGHRAQRTHAAVALELLAVDEDQIAGALVTTGQQRAEHHRVGTGHDRFRGVTGVLETTITDDRDTGRLRRPGGLIDRGDLGDADTGDHPRRADRARPDTDLDAIHPGVDERAGGFVGGDVSADDVDIAGGHLSLEPLDELHLCPGMTMRGIDHQTVDALLDDGHRALPGVAEDADRGTDAQASLRILAGLRVLVGLHEVLEGDQATQASGVVDQRQLLDLVLGQQRERIVRLDANRCGDQRHLGHDLADQSGGVALEAHVTVGDDAEQHHGRVDHRNAADAVGGTQFIGLAQGGVRADGDRLVDHAGLGALHLVDHAGLVVDRQVAVQDAQTALAGHRDGHPLLGDGVHRGRQERHIEGDVAAQPSIRPDLARDDIRFPGLQQDVVERQAQSFEHWWYSGGSQLFGHRTSLPSLSWKRPV